MNFLLRRRKLSQKLFNFGGNAAIDNMECENDFDWVVIISWSGFIFIEHQKIADLPVVLDRSKRMTWTAQGKVNLATGNYDFGFRLVCAGNGLRTQDAVAVDVMMAARGDLSAKSIPAEMSGIKE